MLRLTPLARKLFGSATAPCLKKPSRAASSPSRQAHRQKKRKGGARQPTDTAVAAPSPPVFLSAKSRLPRHVRAAPGSVQQVMKSLLNGAEKQEPGAPLQAAPPIAAPAKASSRKSVRPLRTAPALLPPLSLYALSHAPQRPSPAASTAAEVVCSARWDGVSPATLQSRLRCLVVQLVLLSPLPLRPSELFEQLEQAMDATTRAMLACATHSVTECEQANGTPCSKRDGVSAAAAVAAQPGPSQSAAEQVEKVREVGRAFIAMYRASVVPFVAALRQATERDGVSAAPVPPCRDVAEWMLLHLLFCDPELRVSPYGGAVCYPTLPSLLLASYSHLQEPARLSEGGALQWPAAHAEADMMGGRRGSSSAPPVVSLRSAGEAAPSSLVWLDSAAGRPVWTTAHAIFATYDSLSRRSAADAPTGGAAASPSSRLSTAAQRGDKGITPASAAGSPLSNGMLAAETSSAVQHTSGHPLVDYMIRHSPLARAHAAAARTIDADGAAHEPRLDKLLAQSFATLGWNEGTQGSLFFQDYVSDVIAPEGLKSRLLGEYPVARESSSDLYGTNRLVIHQLFRHFVSVPLSVARLSAMLRWNSSVPHAGIYRSLFYMLLVTAANPFAHQTAVGVRRRVRAVPLSVVLFGGGHSSGRATEGMISLGRSGSRSGGRSARGRKKSEVATGPHALRQRQWATTEDDVRAALLQRFAGGTHGNAGDTPTPVADATQTLVRAAFAAEGREVLPRYQYADDSFVELLCFRVQAHARPGGGGQLTPNAAPARPAVYFEGYRLRYVEVLPTWEWTPEETVEYLRTAQQEAEAEGEGVSDHWLEANEEPHLLVCARSFLTVCGRLRAVVDRYAAITTTTAAGGSAAHSPRAGQQQALRAVTLRQLATLSLWAHEYGAEMASEMLFVLLLLNPRYARLHPPTDHDEQGKDGSGAEMGCASQSTARESYGEWRVAFL